MTSPPSTGQPDQSDRLPGVPANPAAGAHRRARAGSVITGGRPRATTAWWRGRASTADATWRPATARSAPTMPGKPITMRAAMTTARTSTSRCRRRWPSKAACIDEAGEPLSRMFVFAARIMAGSDAAAARPACRRRRPTIWAGTGSTASSPATYIVGAEGRRGGVVPRARFAAAPLSGLTRAASRSRSPRPSIRRR